MKKSFPGYYQPSPEEFKAIWENCIFVIDANVLLNLYRYTPKTRDELINILEKVSDRLWLPYQAALEYHQNRLIVIQQQIDAYEYLQKIIADTENSLKEEFSKVAGKGRHPFMNSDLIMRKIALTLSKIQRELKNLQDSHPNLIEEDPIKNKVTALFNNKVGSPYPPERLNQIFHEGKDRFLQKVPPGYKDQDKGKETSDQYGDLILWFQIIDYAKDNKKSIIFITDDRKEDWWLRIKGKTLGPRPELINEIVSKTDISFYMYSADPFMVKAREYLDQKVSQQAIKEVRGIREQDERDIKNFYKAITTVSEANEAMMNVTKDTIARATAAMQSAMMPSNVIAQAAAAMQTAMMPSSVIAQLGAAMDYQKTLADLTSSAILLSQFPKLYEVPTLRGTMNIQPPITQVESNKIEEEKKIEETFDNKSDEGNE